MTRTYPRTSRENWQCHQRFQTHELAVLRIVTQKLDRRKSSLKKKKRKKGIGSKHIKRNIGLFLRVFFETIAKKKKKKRLP